MTTLTPAQRRARADAILAEADRSGNGIVAAIETVKSRRLFGETTATRPASRPAASTSKKAAKRAGEAQRIARVVTEALTAAAAPKPSPGTTAPASRQAATKPPAKALREMTGDELDAAAATAYRGVGGKSPFWAQPARESAPAAPIREAAPPAPGYPQGPPGASLSAVGVPAIPPPDPAQLRAMDNDSFLELSTAWFASEARQDHRSPFWQVA